MEAKIDYRELSEELKKYQPDILRQWISQLFQGSKRLVSMAGEENLKRMAAQLLDDIFQAFPTGPDINSPSYAEVRKTVETLSGELATKDVTPSETTLFVLSLKDAYLGTIQNYYPQKERLNEVIIEVNSILDGIALITFESFSRKRESIIREQQIALMELSIPIIKIWDRILMVPLIGVLDSQRTQMVMENLLGAIEDTQSKVAILDISGIPVVDTLVAKHLLRTVAAARLMGAHCIVTGVRARISQTMIQLGVDLSEVTTRSTLADGLRVALDLTGLKIVER